MSLNVIDLFAGCGGSTTGAAAVDGVNVRLAVNHWNRAVESHAANHPATDTALCDLHEVHPAAFRGQGDVFLLAGSPECTTHSPGSGLRRKNLQQSDLFDRCDLAPRIARSRATMWTMTHWASVHRPAYVVVENVVEIHYWPEFEAWLREWRTLGYDWQMVYVNGKVVHGLTDAAVTFSMPQSRDRIYVVLHRRDAPRPDVAIRPLCWCAACSDDVKGVQAWKPGRTWGKLGRQYVYRCPSCASEVLPYTHAAAEVIDWTITGPTIGERAAAGRPLSEKTLDRIRYGLKRFGMEPFTFPNRTNGTPRSTRGPLPVLTTAHGGGVALVTLRGTRSLSSVRGDLPTQTGVQQVGVLERDGFLAPYNKTPQASHIREAMPTITSVDRLGFVDWDAPAALCDLRFRLLEPHELLPGGGFPDGYQLVGTKADRVKPIGNSNYPGIEQMLVSRCVQAFTA